MISKVISFPIDEFSSAKSSCSGYVHALKTLQASEPFYESPSQWQLLTLIVIVRHSNYALVVNVNDNSKIFHEDATFCLQPGINGQGSSIRSWSYAARYFRHSNSLLYIAGNSGPHEFDNPRIFNDDASFLIVSSFA